ncbi:hypothetical protein LLE87_26810, partial [Paenibacillus polymyxa]|nr:hypothetical protein [Paenibacillus polymyxa]MCC3261789.1 hypothetical protein [Paenibacillus polymyxa]
HEEDGDPPGSPGKTGVNLVFPETRDLSCKEKKPRLKKTGFLDNLEAGDKIAGFFYIFQI